jgi:hypothetical protein
MKLIKRLLKPILKSVDGGIFNDAFRRAVVHGKVLRGTDAQGRIPRAFVALRRERSVPESDVLALPDVGRFITGITGRSGTTWLTRIMNFTLSGTHAVIGEQGLFVLSMLREAPYEYYQFGGRAAGRTRYLDFFEQNILRWAYKRRRIYGAGLKGLMRYIPKRAVHIAMAELRRELEDLYDLDEIREAFGRFYQRLMNYHAATLFGSPRPWVSKEPPYGRHAAELFQFVPNGRLIVLARDGREIALSMHKRGWSETVRGSMQRWATFTRMTLDALEQVPSGNARIFKYDDTLTNFEERLPEIFSHLELPRPDTAAILASGKKKLIPRTDSIGAWRREISSEDQAWFDDQYGSLMERLGYRS